MYHKEITQGPGVFLKAQLILTILGTNESSILSQIAETVSHSGCNILDSRMAIFGQDFSFTMIIDGTLGAISRAEVLIPSLCQQHELLCVAKRTSQHEKQNLECLYDVEFSGEDFTGLIHKITQFFAQKNISISAFRQKTFTEVGNNQPRMACKMVVSVAKTVDVEDLINALEKLFTTLNLIGSLKDTHTKDNNEEIASWR